jgi:drug/metabolite transporter (DMT)-like permease
MTTSPANPTPARLLPALLLGLAAAAFFSVSFVLNRQMAQADGHWTWSAALRFLMMIPVLVLVVALRGQCQRLVNMWKASPRGWILRGMLSCGLFCAPLVAACAVAPAWRVTATWPVSIVIGIRPPAPLAWFGLTLMITGFLLHARPRRHANSFE